MTLLCVLYTVTSRAIFKRSIIITYKTYKHLPFPPTSLTRKHKCLHINTFFLLAGSCQTVPAIYVKFNALLCLSHTHTQTHTPHTHSKALVAHSNMYVYEYICKSYQSYAYATHYQKWNTNENVRQETNTATKITLKISNFLVSKCFHR